MKTEIANVFRIKNFGVEVECQSFKELISVLESRFKNKSVAITYKEKPDGLLKTAFVDVSNDGGVFLSYGNRNKLTPQDIGV